MLEHLIRSERTLGTLKSVRQLGEAAEALEAGQRMSAAELESLRGLLMRTAPVVGELAAERPEIPPAFASFVRRLEQFLGKPDDTQQAAPAGGQPSAAETASGPDEPESMSSLFGPLITLAEAESKLRKQQDHLETAALGCLTSGAKQTALRHLSQALDVLDQRRSAVADEQQQMFFHKEGKYFIERFVQELLRRKDATTALELVERGRSRAVLSVLGLAALRRPPGAAPGLAAQEETLLTEARRTAHAARSAAVTGDGRRGLELWSRAVELRKQLHDVWSAMSEDPALAEYLSLRQGMVLGLEGIRGLLR
jgi:hypothetical protein